MTGCEPTLIRKESGAQFSVGDAGDVWFPPFPLNNSYRDQLDVIKSLQMRDDDVILTGFPKSGESPGDLFLVIPVFQPKTGPSVSPDSSSVNFSRDISDRCLWSLSTLQKLLSLASVIKTYNHQIFREPKIPRALTHLISGT